jgi:hypothetical protein
MRIRKKSEKILVLFVIFLLVCLIVPINTSATKTLENGIENKINNRLKTIYMKVDCQKIILYRPVISIVHIGPLWFTTEQAYLAFIIDKEFTLKLDGASQKVDVPAMVIPYKFIGLGPLYWIKTIRDPCDGNVTLYGWCEDVVIHPMD